MTTATIVRSLRHGAFKVRTCHWGSYLAPCDDPDGDKNFKPEEAIKEFLVPDDLHRIPDDLWQRWIQLCFYYAPKTKGTSLEVGVRLLVSATDPSKYRIIVPRQSVSGGSVHATNFDDSVDIETGEAIASYPPDGWIPCGSSHSHGTMGAFFSAVDDGNELGDPGLHITVGRINADPKVMGYELVASVTADRRRYRLPYETFVDTAPIKATYHPKVLEWVKAERPPATTIPSIYNDGNSYYGRYSFGYYKNGTWQGGGSSSSSSVNSRGNNATGRRIGFQGVDDDDGVAGVDRPYSWTPGQNQGKNKRRRRHGNTTTPNAANNYNGIGGLTAALYEASFDDLVTVTSDWLTAALVDNSGPCGASVYAAALGLIKLRELIDEVEETYIGMAIDEEVAKTGTLPPFTPNPTGQQLTDAIEQQGGLLLPPAASTDDPPPYQPTMFGPPATQTAMWDDQDGEEAIL